MMKLSEFEQQTAVWQKISEEISQRLTVAREQNDGDLDIMVTARLRGKIAVYREILSWAKTDPQM